jgi:membrane protein implicated in regulation of membrane protease activity
VDHYLIWLIAAFSLVIIELVTGTFYLLVLGLAGFAGAAVAAAGLSFGWQAVTSALVALAGVVYVHHWRKKSSAESKSAPFSVDAGQPAVFESWVKRESRHARVRYRDTSWDAVIEGDTLADAQPGEVFYVVSANGNTLKISKTRPA